jgi:hypothetical protein
LFFFLLYDAIDILNSQKYLKYLTFISEALELKEFRINLFEIFRAIFDTSIRFLIIFAFQKKYSLLMLYSISFNEF